MVITKYEYSARYCLVEPKKKRLPTVKPLSRLRDQEQAYKPRYHDPNKEDLTKAQYKLVRVGTKKVLICTRKAETKIIKVIKSNA